MVVLDDWLGARRTPDEVLKRLEEGMGGMSGGGGMGGMDMGGMDMGGGKEEPGDEPLGSDTGDVRYPTYLINGRPPTDPATFAAKPGERLPAINAGSDTPFRVALGGHRLTVTPHRRLPGGTRRGRRAAPRHGERYDALVHVPDAGGLPVGRPRGRDDGRRHGAILRTGADPAPMAGAVPDELGGRLLGMAESARQRTSPSRAGSWTGSIRPPSPATWPRNRWGVQAESDDGVTLPVHSGERIRLVLENATQMWHPLHLHGHTFQVVTGAGRGPRKDTAIVPAGTTVGLDVEGTTPASGSSTATTSITGIGDADSPVLRDLSRPARSGPIAPSGPGPSAPAAHRVSGDTMPSGGRATQ